MKGKGKGNRGNQDQDHGLELDGIITDKRFVHLHSDPRFMRLPRNNSKVSIDSRFHRMFSDKNFSESSSLAFDKRGRPKKKSETNKLHQFYYHLNQDEEEEEKEDGTSEQAEKNDEPYTEKTQKKNDEGNTNRQKEGTETVGFLSSANSTQKLTKGRKKGNTDRAKQEEMAVGFSGNVSADEHGHENTDGVEALDIVKTTGVDDPQKKKKMKKKKKKEQEMDDRFVDLDETLYAKEGHEDNVGAELKEIKKKKNKIKVEEDMCTDEAHENNQAVKLKKKKKRDRKNNNTLVTSEEKMYMGEGDVEQVKEKKEQVRAQSEVEARMASVSCKSNSNVGSTSKKKRDGSKPKRGGENVSVEEELDVTEPSRRKGDIDDRKKLKSKPDSIFGAGRKGSTTVAEFGKKDHGNEEDQETSESESFSDDYFDLSESEENETSSSSDNDDDYGDQIELEFPQQEEVPTLDSETRRLAVVNMDWNHIKAVDLLVCMNSFLPKGGQILTVAVYPSEFGLKRMAEEAVRGPAIFGSDDESSEDDEDELENEKLRQYEKDRLRYYFAVIECDSSATSSYLYKACDGVEFERTSNVLDLRFIPDDMEFDHPPRDVATEIPTNYLAPDYHTRALQHSKVNIAWDDDEPLRVKTLHCKFDPDQLNEMDFKAYLASDDEVSDGDDDGDDDDGSQENGEDGENKKKSLRENYRALLLESGDPSEGREDKDDKDMEITFNTGLEDLSKRILEKSKKNNSEETVWEAYLQKRSEKRKAKKKLAERSSEDETSNSDGEYADDGERDNQSDDFFLDEESLDTGKKTGLTVNSSNMKKAVKKETKLKPLSTKMKDEEDASKAELELLLADDHGFENGVRGYNLKAKKTKGRKRDMPSEDKLPTVDNDDPRFSALFTSHHFAIDPTDPQFKRSATYSRSIVQKQQKKFADKSVDDLKPFMEKNSTFEDSSTKKRKTELLSLVKSVKRKVGAVDPS